MFRNFGFFDDNWAVFFLIALIASGSDLRVAVDDVGDDDVVAGVFSVKICVLGVV